jgi:hypothetical protein
MSAAHKKTLRFWAGEHRARADSLEKMRDVVRTLSQAAIRDPGSPSDVTARYRVALDMWGALIVECRAIADQADKLLQHKEAPPAEFASLSRRVWLLAAQTLAVTTEVSDAAMDTFGRVKEPILKPRSKKT